MEFLPRTNRTAGLIPGSEPMLKLYTKIQSRLASTERDDEGAALVEYGLLVSIIAIGVLAALGGVRDALIDIFGQIAAAL
jgi:Flp pilus assembly pilin Flp